MYKQTQNANSIIELQQENGMWGNFHALSEPSNKPYTSEQALRRLEILGYTKEDKSIQQAIDYMTACLEGKVALDTRREKSHNWDYFTDLMLSTWIRRFCDNVDIANEIASKWAYVVSCGFNQERFNDKEYNLAYEKVFGEKIYGGIFKDCSNFYHVSMLKDILEPDIERKYVNYILNHEGGIYYLGYSKTLKELPDVFDSKQTVKFLASINLLLDYESSKGQFDYVYKWLNQQKTDEKTWVLSTKAKDKIYLPLSDSWRQKDTRISDCTYFISNIVDKIKLD